MKNPGMNKTLYIKKSDADKYDKARNYLKLYENRSLGDFIAEKLQEVISKYEEADAELKNVMEKYNIKVRP